MACLSNFIMVANPMPQVSATLPTCKSVKCAIFQKTEPNSGVFPSSESSSRVYFSCGDVTILKSQHSLGIRIWRSAPSGIVPIMAVGKPEPLKIMISGPPASGKGTQCELITKKFGLVHIAAGDLLRAEVASGTENGKRAKEFMEKGLLVPDEIVVMMVKGRLLQPDAKEKGWLLDGYPRSLSQATALENLGIRPDLFIVLDVPEESLVERVVGRRLDPVTGKIYHLKYSPPETEEIAARLTQRFDDTEEKVKLRLRTHHQNVEAVLAIYQDVTIKINGNLSMEDVFTHIETALAGVLAKKENIDSASMATGMSL